MSWAAIIGSLGAAVFAALSLLHVYWAFGGQRASVGVIPHVGGKPVFKPSMRASLLVALALAAACALMLFRIGALPWPFPDVLLQIALRVLGAAFALRAIGDFKLVGLFKRVRGTRFAQLDSWLFCPLCIALASAAFFLA